MTLDMSFEEQHPIPAAEVWGSLGRAGGTCSAPGELEHMGGCRASAGH